MGFFQRCFSKLIFAFVKFLVCLRYRVTIQGLESIGHLEKKGGILFLPNHPALLDPVILSLLLWQKFHFHPLVVERFFYMRWVSFCINLVKGFPLPEMDMGVNRWKEKQVQKQFETIVIKLKQGENFLIYPSGRLKATGSEAVGGASLVHNLISAYPEVNIVLIRTTGLWGSSFSRALTGKSPSFAKTLLNGAKILLKNGIFFAPRRKITVEIAPAPNDLPRQGERLVFNKYLEGWYNRYPPDGKPIEPLTFVSYAFWKQEFPEVMTKEQVRPISSIKVPENIEKAVIDYLAELTHRTPDQIDKKMDLSADLGLDSLDAAQLYVFLEDRYHVHTLRPGSIQTVDDLLQVAAGNRIDEEEEEKEEIEAKWPKDRSREEVMPPDGETIQQAFLNCCKRMKGATACADNLTGTLSYSKLKKVILILSQVIKDLPGEHVGILLPSSIGVYLLILATLFAKKIPVMLNWTTGPRSLNHSADLCNLQVVLTSRRFLDRLENADLGKIEDQLIFLEDLRKKISLKQKIKGLFLSWKSNPSLIKALRLDSVHSKDHAVVLFTSGTETLPKGVPLTHENLLSNQSAVLKCIKLNKDDVFMGVLPPFHSFGFSATGLLPLLSGLKVFYAPDPTDSRSLARDIFNWKTTLFCCAPSFIKALFHVADPKQLQSVQLFVSGAERTPQELFDYVAKLGSDKKLIEGYGITECSPVVTFDRVDRPHKGVGQPLPNIELCVIDEENNLLPQGKEGEVCIHGPSVFSGYLGNIASPFITLQGKQWFRSGDRGYLDADGTLILSGRLKRFIKIGGEMVSLGGLEEELAKMAIAKQWASAQEGPSLAVSVRGKETDKPFIVLFTTFDVNKDDINKALKESGYGRIVKISEIRKLDQIPLTGTGKTHYRLLDEMTI